MTLFNRLSSSIKKAASLAALLTGLTIPLTVKEDLILDLPPEYEIEKLMVNPQLGRITYVNKSEAEGIKDLKPLIENSLYEESWAYLPEEQKWLELGKKSYLLQDDHHIYGSIVEMYDQKLEYILNNKPFSTLYHFHPHKLYSEENLEDKIDYSLPSPIDLTSMAMISILFPKNYTQFKVASAHGIMSYSLTELGLNFFSVLNPKDLSLFMIIYEEKVFEYAKMDPDFQKLNLTEKIYDLAEKWSDSEIVKLEFTPY